MTYEELKKRLKESGKKYDLEMIDKAYRLANEKHAGVFRKQASRISSIPWRLPDFWWNCAWILPQ